MARRKIRPLAIATCIAVFLVFSFLRKGGQEVFTFDSLPPYTDANDYVKKPTPIPLPIQEPPPPPPEWGQHSVHEGNREHIATPQNPPIRPQPEAQDFPMRERPQPNPQTLGDEITISKDDHEIPLNTSPESGFANHPGHTHGILDQPPAPGDSPLGGLPFIQRPMYTPEELAPRIEKYPISPQDIIKLPRMRHVTLPKIQARFPAESSKRRRTRLQRQAAIKRAMIRSWEAYSTYAMGHDEVRPVSGQYHDPFCGWGATLVDSLDTLQIMGMQTEYREALKYVAEIDFAHTRSYNIPLFETVIRYLGGLLGAYDTSEGKDTILLDKAKDLADMLMGSFDTINRMPLLRYDWRPQAARQNLRASDDSCLAELGTLTLEFTRLAQLTGNHSYYDAVLPFLR
jgi:mannosyl-oligosaccharide alpha-1,2-mannosidase